jgi:hypothetical protein
MTRLYLLSYTLICWFYPLLTAFNGRIGGAFYIILLVFSALLIITINYYLLYKIFITPPFTNSLYKTTMVTLSLTIVLLAYFNFEALRVNQKSWISYLPLTSMILTLLILLILIRKKPVKDSY